jgi:ATP phosphoribosyltransferase regulatory subunit
MIDSDDTVQTNRALLPNGLRDLLPPDAQHEARVVEQLMTELSRHGFDRVKPPLIEFEQGLLSGPGAALMQQTFRLMDPVSQQMMGVRADMTLQVARIASSRLSLAPRPLRLSYAGQVLRVKGTQLRPERQFGQVGAELIGSLRTDADAEMVLLAASALTAIGARDITIDLCVPTLVPAICRSARLSPTLSRAVAAALARRDGTSLQGLDGLPDDLCRLLLDLMATAGPAPAAVERLSALALPSEAESERTRLVQVARLVIAAAPDLPLTIDPVEQRGFEYQTGPSFTIFARDVRGELGRGGRYRIGGTAEGEPATGFTLYTDTVLQAIPGPAPARRILVPHGTAFAAAAGLRAEGWQTVATLEPGHDLPAEARRLGCRAVFIDDQVVAV